MRFTTPGLARVSGSAALGLAALQATTFAVARAVGRHSVVDVVWGPGLAGVAVGAGVFGRGDRLRRGLLAAGVSAWGARLGAHIFQRSRGKGEDPRYAELLEGASTATVLRKVYLTQGVAQWFISLPIQVAAVSGPPQGWRRWLVPLGAATMAAGMTLEAVADAQLARYRARDRQERPAVLDSGVWGWSRHPNYFGDATVWVGVYLVAAAAAPGAWTVLSPVAMSYFLVVATGARRLERTMAERPAYREYQQRTSFFVPWPPGRAPFAG